jgi:predicted RND superfamily exporter protein
MSLRIFHLFFIIVSVLLAFGVAAWGWGQGAEQRMLTVVCAVLGVGLLAYGVWFVRCKFSALK